MYEQLKSTRLPSKQKFAKTFLFLSHTNYWIHLFLGIFSGVLLLLVAFSYNQGENSSSGFGLDIILAIFSLIALVFRVYWGVKYRKLAKTLQTNPDLSPSRQEIVRVLRVGLSVSLLGLFLAFLASEISLVSLVTTAISRPQGIAIYERAQVVKIADLFLILAQLNILGAHFFGSANSLGLLSWLSKEDV
jgi:hypothetical protein